MIQIVRITDALPEDFEQLRADAAADGWRHMDRLADEWADGAPDMGEGEALMAAFVDGEIAGVGALTVEPAEAGTYRLRRFYVVRAHRGAGVGRTLASALMQEGLGRSHSLTVHAGEPEAGLFWEAMGFRRDDRNGWSHRYGDG